MMSSEGTSVRTEGRRAAAVQATRRAIVDAARELLATRRWDQFTVEAVAGRAGVTRVTVYNQVRSKRGLLDAVLTDLTERARMDQLLTDTRDRPAPDACAAIVRRTCRFWHAERDILRPLFGLAGIDREVASTLEQREGWRGEQMAALLRRMAEETGVPAAVEPGEALAGVIAVTSFPAYDALGVLADHPDRAARLVTRLVRSLTG